MLIWYSASIETECAFSAGNNRENGGIGEARVIFWFTIDSKSFLGAQFG